MFPVLLTWLFIRCSRRASWPRCEKLLFRCPRDRCAWSCATPFCAACRGQPFVFGAILLVPPRVRHRSFLTPSSLTITPTGVPANCRLIAPPTRSSTWCNSGRRGPPFACSTANLYQSLPREVAGRSRLSRLPWGECPTFCSRTKLSKRETLWIVVVPMHRYCLRGCRSHCLAEMEVENNNFAFGQLHRPRVYEK